MLNEVSKSVTSSNFSARAELCEKKHDNSHQVPPFDRVTSEIKTNKLLSKFPSPLTKCCSVVSGFPHGVLLNACSNCTTYLKTISSPSFPKNKSRSDRHSKIPTSECDRLQTCEERNPVSRIHDMLKRALNIASDSSRFNFSNQILLRDKGTLTSRNACYATSRSVRADNSVVPGGQMCGVIGSRGAGRRRKFCRERSISWLVFSLLVCCVGLVTATTPHDTELCVVEDPLETPYFTSLLEAAAPCLLCRRSPAAGTGSSVDEMSSLYREVKQAMVVDHRGIQQQDTLNSEDDVTVKVRLSDSMSTGTVALVIHSTCEKCSFSVMVETRSSSGVNLLLLTRDPALVRVVTPPDEEEASAVQVLFMPFNFTGDDAPSALLHFTASLFVAPITYVSTERATLIAIQGSGLESSTVSECPTTDAWVTKSGSHDGDGVSCRRQARQHLSGCYHHHMIGNHAQDIHIIDVQGSGNTNGSLVLEVHGLPSRQHSSRPSSKPSSQPSSQPSEDFSFGGNLTQGGRVRRGPVAQQDLVVRNITLVLRSVRPVTWLVRPSSIQGTITVLLVGDGQMENGSSAQYGRHASGVTVVTKKETMPTSFDQFILTVLSRVGYPISYTNSTVPNKIIVTVPSDNEYHSSADARHEPRVHQRKADALALLKEELRVECSAVGAVVAVPAWAADRLPNGGPVTLALSDPSCRSTSNGTHLLISAAFRDCSFQRLNHPGYTTYTNSIYMTVSAEPVSDDEDMAGSGLGPDETSDLLSITCDVDASVGDVTSAHVFDEEDDALYELKVYAATSANSTALTLLQPTARPAYVDRGTILHVTASLRTRIGMEDLQVVLESCWFEPLQEMSFQHTKTPHPTTAALKPLTAEVQAGVSTLPYPEAPPTPPPATHVAQHHGKSRKSRKRSRGSLSKNRSQKVGDRIELVRKSCAVLPSVVVSSSSSSFTLTVGDEMPHETEWGLRCSVGVCSPGSLPRPGVNKCTKPSSYCAKEDLMRLFQDQAAASQLQDVQFGPVLFQSLGADPSVRTTDGSSAQSVLVMKGVATEMVFVISFVSFVVGVALTSLLWFLHSKFGCSRGCKSGLRSLEPPRGGACGAPSSGGSTPSSQAPMTVGG